MEICKFSRPLKANQFMDWIWDIVEKYRNHDFIHILQQDNTVNEKLIELLTSMNNPLSKLEEQSTKKKMPEKKYSCWKTNTFRKFNTLLAYVNGNSDENLKLSEVIYLVIGETEDTDCDGIHKVRNIFDELAVKVEKTANAEYNLYTYKAFCIQEKRI